MGVPPRTPVPAALTSDLPHLGRGSRCTPGIGGWRARANPTQATPGTHTPALHPSWLPRNDMARHHHRPRYDYHTPTLPFCQQQQLLWHHPSPCPASLSSPVPAPNPSPFIACLSTWHVPSIVPAMQLVPTHPPRPRGYPAHPHSPAPPSFLLYPSTCFPFSPSALQEWFITLPIHMAWFCRMDCLSRARPRIRSLYSFNSCCTRSAGEDRRGEHTGAGQGMNSISWGTYHLC